MKLVVLVLSLALVGNQVIGYLITVPKYVLQIKPATNDWVHRQKLILWLFEDICEDSVNPTIVRLANEFSFELAASNYDNPDSIQNIQNLLLNNGITPKGEIISEFNKDHVEEMRIIYNFLYNAKSFDAFYNAAAWSRQHTNCGIFIDAVYAAIFHRRDTEKIAIPPPYELLPNYFIVKDFITKGILVLNNEEDIIPGDVLIEGNMCTINANYTADFIENEEESKLAYFLEDIGLNSYYFFNRLMQEKWTKQINENTNGEYWYHLIKQLITRYNLERYANGFSEVEEFSFNDVSNVKYNSQLIYSNGNDMTAATVPDDIKNSQDYIIMNNIESNIDSVINDLVSREFNNSQILNHLMDILVFGNNSYESTAINLLGYSKEMRMSSVLAHYMTMLRDPIYWKILKKITNLVEQTFKYVPGYERNELYFPGVKVSDILIKKTTTNFDTFTFDVTNAMKSNTSRRDLDMKISQLRLGNKPLSFKINVTSSVTKKGLVKIYLGSRALPLEQCIKDLFLLDSFEYTFKIGTNIISKSTDQMHLISKDLLSIKTLYNNIEDAEFGLETISLDNVKSYADFPARLVFPRGSSELGVVYQMLIFVAPFIKSKKSDIHSTEFNSAVLSPNYPFDLLGDSKTLYSIPNCMLKQILITHKGNKKPIIKDNDNNEWSSKNYETYDYENKQQSGKFDYKAKKDKYAKKQFKSVDTTTTHNIFEAELGESDAPFDSKFSSDYFPDTVETLLVDKGNTATILTNNIDDNFKEQNNQEDATDFMFKTFPRVFDYVFRLPYNIDDDSTNDRVYE